MTTIETMGQRIHDLCVEKEITHKEIAEYCNKNNYKCSEATISNIVNGVDKGVDYRTIIGISKCLGVSIDYLVGIRDEPTTDIEIQAICEYTGLNEITIARLTKCKKTKDNVKILEDIYKQLDLSKMFNIMCENEIFINMFCSNFLNYLDDEKTEEIKEKLWFDGDIMLGVDVSSMFLVNIQQNIADLKSGKWKNRDKAFNTTSTRSITLETKPIENFEDRVIKPSEESTDN